MTQAPPDSDAVLPTRSNPEPTPAQREEQFGARSLSLYVRLTPLLWAGGLLSPLAAILLLRLSLRHARWVRFGAVAWSWWLIGAMQAVSVVVNWVDADLPFRSLLYRLAGATVTGWFFIGAAIGAGRAYRLASARVTRSVCVLGLYVLAVGLVSLLIAFASGMDSLSVKSPLAFLFPDDLPFVEHSLVMRFFLLDDTLGRTIPRLVLFYPWSVCLGFAGIAIFMIALQDPDRRWRLIGMSGGLFGIVASMSRGALVAFLAAGAVYAWQRVPRACKYGALALGAVTGAVVMTDVSVTELVSDLFTSVTEAREGSWEARQVGYDESWHGFLRSPVFGSGWPGELISNTIPMPIGSHSTVYGVLYTGGLLTFLPLCLAFALTLVTAYLNSVPHAPASCAGLSVAVALVVLSYGEGIQSFALPATFAFLWLGGALCKSVPA
jgi:hypothetical protein